MAVGLPERAFAYVFDLLTLDGANSRALPWRERRAELQRIGPFSPPRAGTGLFRP
jgi:ATP-dependent DNA ligase